MEIPQESNPKKLMKVLSMLYLLENSLMALSQEEKMARLLFGMLNLLKKELSTFLKPLSTHSHPRQFQFVKIQQEPKF
jgi:hypothetical protein